MVVPRWQELDAYCRSLGIRVGTATLGQTTGGTHTAGSYHYQGLARDFGLYNCDCVDIAAALEPLAQGPNHAIVELIWTPAGGIPAGTYFKNGNRYTPSPALANGHRDHVHAAIRPGAPPLETLTPQPDEPEEIDMAAYAQTVKPGEQTVVALPAIIAGGIWKAVSVSLASQADGAKVRFAIEPSARIVQDSLAVPKGRKYIVQMQPGDEAVTVVNKGPQAVSVLVEAW